MQLLAASYHAHGRSLLGRDFRQGARSTAWGSLRRPTPPQLQRTTSPLRSRHNSTAAPHGAATLPNGSDHAHRLTILLGRKIMCPENSNLVLQFPNLPVHTPNLMWLGPNEGVGCERLE